MTSTTKIILGALLTAILAWFMHGPWKGGERCAAAASANAVPAAAPVAAAEEKPATAEAVANCQTKVDAIITGKTINFSSGGSAIAPESLALIESLANELKACAGTSVEVAGHTDKSGGDAANQRLSENRANSVVEALVQRGVPVQRLIPKGYGETTPVDPADTPAAYAKNRRIEFKVAATAAAPSSGQ